MQAIRHPRLHVKRRPLPAALRRRGERGVRSARWALVHPGDGPSSPTPFPESETDPAVYEQLRLDLAGSARP